jgi:hypothetical protein
MLTAQATPVVTAATKPPPGIIELACATLGRDIHLCAATEDGDLLHTIRHSVKWWERAFFRAAYWDEFHSIKTKQKPTGARALLLPALTSMAN